jgi:Flp pilus assembly protein TadD
MAVSQESDRIGALGAALARLQAGHWGAVREAVGPLLARDPADMEALLLHCLALAADGRCTEAAEPLNAIARQRPELAHPCTDLCTLLQSGCDAARIRAQFRACLRLAPDDLRLTLSFAAFLQQQDEPAEAAKVLRAAIDTGADSAAVHHAMGLSLAALGRIAEAAWHFQRAVETEPGPAEGWSNLGMMLKARGDCTAALSAHHQAMARAPDNPRIRVNRAVALLHAGQWTEGWAEYEWRLRLPGQGGLGEARRLPPLPLAGELDGRTVLVTHEGGFGDTLQFTRYLPLLAQRGAHVVAWVPAPLVRLIQGVRGVDAVIGGARTTPPDHHWHCAFPSLPFVFGTAPEAVPAGPYLHVPPELAIRWKRRLPPWGTRAGLVWAGESRPGETDGLTHMDRRRSMRLDDLAPLAAVKGVQFVSLQMGPAAAEAAHPPRGMILCDPMQGVADFMDTAAIIADLDLVISVDTAVAHLAGAMGKKVFLLDRYDNCWRWLSGRVDSPWYPGLTIFRQRRMGDWKDPVSRAAAALHAFTAFTGDAEEPSRPFLLRQPEDAA